MDQDIKTPTQVQSISMSAEALSRLSLGATMVMTRAQAGAASRAQTTVPHTPQQSPQQSPSQSSFPSAASSPTPSLIESAFGLKYNISTFDNDARRRVKMGMMKDNDINMKYCRTSPDERMKYTFYIEDDIAIAMGGSYTVPRCSCGANEGGMACKHIFWILDKLAQGAPANVRSQTLQMAVDGSTLHTQQPSKLIDNMGIETVSHALDWPLQYGQSPNPKDIEDDIAEMLSVFEPSDALPAQSKDPAACPSERSRKFREFRDLFTQYATADLGMFLRMKAVITPDFQAQVFFEKIKDRTARVFEALDMYMAQGPTADARTERYDIPTCAGKLKGLVKAINDYYHQQIEHRDSESESDSESDSEDEDAGTKDIAIRAATALISILDGVAERNKDAYANVTWGAIPPSNPSEANLFVNLIGAPRGHDGLFVLDTLEALPHDDVLRNHWESLQNLYDKLTHAMAPPVYMKAFHAFTHGRKRAASQTGGSSAKRTMQ